jgi:uncharacterized protein YggE
LAKVPHTEIEGVSWSLTKERREELSSGTRKMALKNALTKAVDCADVLGKSVSLVEIRDREEATVDMIVQSPKPRSSEPGIQYSSVPFLPLQQL